MPQVLNQRGAALVTALLLTMLSLVMALTLLFVVSTGSRISASQRSYRTALAAAHGGVELFTQEIIPLMFDSGTSAGFLEDRLARVHLQVGEFACLQQKLSVATAGWSQACRDKADADPARFPDATFRLASGRPSEPGFTVSTKIVDSVPGNSDRGGLDYLDLGGGWRRATRRSTRATCRGSTASRCRGCGKGGRAGRRHSSRCCTPTEAAPPPAHRAAGKKAAIISGNQLYCWYYLTESPLTYP